MTRLEHLDSYRTDFEAWLEEIEPAPRGAWWRLDVSAFYPTSGGQQHDTGDVHALGRNYRVADVTLRDGEVWHLVTAAEDVATEDVAAESATATLGAAVTGRVDWSRRFRHMQRHTAQHLLSQAFVRLDVAYATRSVALSGADLTLDLAGDPDDDAIAEAERQVNDVAARALPIRAFEIDEASVPLYPLRRPPKVRGRIRVVAMGTWEHSACGGTHLRSTAEALPVLVTGRERVRGDLVRVTFRAGLEAIAHASATGRAAAAAAALLSSAVPDLPARVEALQRGTAEARRRIAALERDVADALAIRLVGAAGDEVVVHLLEGDDTALLTPLADALAARGATAALGARDGCAARVVLA
nr:alanyl-tRNA editing protein [Trueperaceae bacterium]